MNEQQIDRLAELIADALRAHQAAPASSAAPRETWLPVPVRPEPSRPPAEPPAWSGAAQMLDDAPRHRATTAELTVAARSAAAGRGTAPSKSVRTGAAPRRSQRAGSGLPVEVPIGVSNRHLHLSIEHAKALFGRDALTVTRQLSQPGQFAAAETVTVIGPRGRIEGVRVVGPPRDATQFELSLTDARRIGIEAPVAASGALERSSGGVRLEGSAGSVALDRGVIIAARHLHVSPDDAGRWGVRDGDQVDVRCGRGAREVRYAQVLVRSGPSHATELHLDTDEAFAAGVATGDRATIVAHHPRTPPKRVLITERDVLRIARAGERLPDHALLTPSARDRAGALRLLDR